MIVCKFGGSSLADATHMKKVADIITSNAERSVVVVSAPGKRNKSDKKVTDMLYDCEALVRKGEPFGDVYAAIKERYVTIAKELGLPFGVLDEILDEVGSTIAKGAGPDYAASRGEFLHAKLMALYLGWEFVDAQELVVIEDDGTVAEETYERIEKVLNKETRYIFPGFYGVSREGKVKTFSRGGSDITGAIVARALKADIYENWTDVSGVSMADPRIVSDAKVIKEMTYHEVRELAAVGFSVFHEEAISPVRIAGIPIQVKNTNKPEDEGTSIVPERETKDTPIVGVTAKSGYCTISVHKMLLFKRLSVRAHMEQTLRTLGIVPEFCFSGIDSMVWVFPISQVSDGLIGTVAPLLKEEFSLDDAVCETGFAVVGITGQGIASEPRLGTTLWPSLEKNHIQTEFICYGASPITCLIGIREQYIQQAIETIYDAIIR